MNADRLFYGLDELMRGVGDLLARPAAHYCRLETAAGESTLVADDGSMVTVLALEGAMVALTGEEFDHTVDTIEAALSPWLARPGHAVQVVLRRDPGRAREQVEAERRGAHATAERLGLDLADVLRDWERALAARASAEHVWMALWTRPYSLPPAERRRARREMMRAQGQAPGGRHAQRAARVMDALSDGHEGFVAAIEGALATASQHVRRLDAHEALWWLRHEADPAWTAQGWRPRLPGDPLPVRWPEPGAPGWDASHLLYPPLAEQVMPRDAEIIDRQRVRVGGRVHAPVVMSVPPRQVAPAGELVRAAARERVPFRASWLIEGDGLSRVLWRAALSAVLHVASPANRRFNRAMDELRERALSGESVVSLRVAFDTWAEDERGARANAARLAALVQSWGGSEVSEIVGDPLLGVVATLPAAMPASPAPAAAAPLAEALAMLPIARPVAPWRTGPVLLRSPDGKPVPLGLVSSEQAAWVDVGVAPMGAGKSVWLSTLNLGFVLQAGLHELPWVSIIDIGPSSSGLIALLRAALPPECRHLAAYHRLRMDTRHAINPCDTPLGARRPLPSHEAFLVNLLSLLATPLDADAPPEGVAGLAREAITAVYAELAPERHPHRYEPGVDAVVDEALPALSMELDEATSWWELADALFEAGLTHEATRAQRFAVPTLAEVATQARHRNVADRYAMRTAAGESVAEHFWRSLMEAIAAYPVLSGATRFDLGEARVVSLDLDEVAPRGGAAADRQAAVMYMLARHVAAGRLFVTPDDVGHFPERYRAHQARAAAERARLPKRLCYDEAHRVLRAGSVAAQIVGDLEVAVRESRKWNLSVGLYSQSIEDFPDILVELATSVYLLGAGTERMARALASRFALLPPLERALTRLGQPGPAGAAMAAVLRTRMGTVQQVLVSTLGARLIWAFSTTAEDRAVRDALYRRLGAAEALERLAARYPGGVKREVEARRAVRDDGGDAEAEAADVIDEIVEELSAEGAPAVGEV